MNNNIQEDYCSYEVSKLLQEKGFDIFTLETYNKKGKVVRGFYGKGHYYPYLTHGLAIKWIRENFNVCLSCDYSMDGDSEWNFAAYRIDRKITTHVEVGFTTNESATEAGLLYILQNYIP